MRQLVQDLRSGSLEVVDVPDPRAGPNEVLVRTTWSLISAGTEQALARTASKSLIGKARERPDDVRKVIDKARADGVGSAVAAVRARLDDLLTPGYSSAGVVEAVGSNVSALKPGARVACVGANVAVHAERVVVPEPLCVPIPDELEDRFAAFGAVGAVAAHALRTAEVSAGSIVVVVGLGLVGQLVAQLATAAGARTIGVDVLRDRADLATRLGAAGTVLGRDDVERRVAAISDGHGADAIIIAAATDKSGPLELAGEVARDRATVVAVGDVGLTVPRAAFYAKELQLRVSRSYGPGRYDAAYEHEGHDYPIGYVRWTERRLVRFFLEEVEAGRVRLGELITHEFPIEQATAAYEALGETSRLAVLIRYGPVAPTPTRRAEVTVPRPSKAGQLRAGLIGPGTFARSTLLPLLKDLDVDLVAVSGRTPARSLGVARRWHGVYVATDAEEILSDPAIDVVIIATRHDSHAELAARALEAGKAVFLEKPLTVDAAGLSRLEPFLQQEARLVVDFNRSLSPAARRLSAHFGDRAEPLSVNYRVNAGYLEPSHWLRDPAVGGGRVVGEGCHFVDFCSALIGRRLESVQAVSMGKGPTTLQGDNFVVLLRYEDGSLGTVTYVSGGDRAMPKERIEALGVSRSAVIDDFRKVELFSRGRRSRTRPFHVRDKGHTATMAAALRFFQDGGRPPIPYERLLETTRATLVARDALANGQEEAVSLGSV